MRSADGIDYIGIGNRVREKRRELKLTQEALAERVGISTSFIGHIERAEKVASVETMMKIAYAMDTTLDYLVCGIVFRCNRERCPVFADIDQMLHVYGILK